MDQTTLTAQNLQSFITDKKEKGRGEKILRRILKWLSSSPKEIQFKVEVTELFGFKEIQV